MHDFQPFVGNYHGKITCNLSGLPEGRYDVVITYARDRVGNVKSDDVPTGIWYNVTN